MNSQGSTHAWNKVNVGGKWYNIDSTWGDPSNKGGKFIDYPFFLVPDSWTKSSHLDVNTKTLSSGAVIHFFDTPACTNDDLNYFRIMNREFTGVDAGYAGLKAEVKRAIEAGALVAEVRVTDSATFETLTSTSYWRELQKYAETIKPGVTLKRVTNDRAESLIVQYNIDY
jgi:hypothetical protein